MGSEWTDESVIRRDLSLAQGQWVPCGIDAVVAGAKPPTQIVEEETEEEYYKHWTSDGDFSTGPDLSLIKTMLEMVHNDGPEDEDSSPAPLAEIEIRKVEPKPLPLPFVLNKKTKLVKTKEKPIKPRRARNAAIASLLAIEQKAPEIPIKLSKPEDFIIKEKPAPNKNEIDSLKRKNESVKKVNSWLHTQNLSCMFKKKSMNIENEDNKNKENEKQNCAKTVGSGGKCDVSYKKSARAYTPSSCADEYYQTFVKRSHMQQIVKENIWARAEKLMKEIDDRKTEEIRKQEEVEVALNVILEAAEEEICRKSEANDHESNNDSENPEQHEPTKELTGFEKVELPQHRHQLTGECIVCEVLLKKSPDQKNPSSSPKTPHTEESSEGSEESGGTFTVQNESDVYKSDETESEISNFFIAPFVENLADSDKTDFKENEELDIFA